MRRGAWVGVEAFNSVGQGNWFERQVRPGSFVSVRVANSASGGTCSDVELTA